MTTLAAKIETLTTSVAALGGRDREFALSLIDQYERRGDLSPKQIPWVDTLIERAQAAAAPKAEKPVLAFSVIASLFETAGRNLKRPSLVLSAPWGGEVRIKRAGEQSREPGSLVLVDRPGFDATYFGRISRTGELTLARSLPASRADALTAMLCEFSADPATYARMDGKRTGRCCCCARELTDPVSVEMGIGPVCADRWGLTRPARPLALAG